MTRDMTLGTGTPETHWARAETMQKEEKEQRLEGNGPILEEAYENRPKPWKSGALVSWGLTDMRAETQAARLCVGRRA